MHARALLPQGNWFKSLQTKWRLFQLMLQSGSQPEKAAALEEQLLGEVRVLGVVCLCMRECQQ
jgi:hypothetical protein